MEFKLCDHINWVVFTHDFISNRENTDVRKTTNNSLLCYELIIIINILDFWNTPLSTFKLSKDILWNLHWLLRYLYILFNTNIFTKITFLLNQISIYHIILWNWSYPEIFIFMTSDSPPVYLAWRCSVEWSAYFGVDN